MYSKTLSHASKPKLPQEKCYQIMDFHLDKIPIIVAFSAIISSFYWETCLKYMYDRNLDFANFLVTSGYTSRLKCASCASIISIENFPKKNRQISTVEKLKSHYNLTSFFYDKKTCLLRGLEIRQITPIMDFHQWTTDFKIWGTKWTGIGKLFSELIPRSHFLAVNLHFLG